MIAEAVDTANEFFNKGKDSAGIFTIGRDAINAYRHKEAGESNTEVMGKLLGKFLSQEMDEAAIGNMAESITQGVEDYDAAMGDLEASEQAGISQQEWMQEKLIASAPGETMQEKGEYLYDVLRSLKQGNGQLMGKEYTIEAELAEWDEESVQRLAAAVAQEAAASGALATDMTASQQGESLAINAGTAENEEDGEDDEGFFERHGKMLKLAGSGTLTICTRLGKIPFLSKGTDVNILTNAACGAVEIAKAGFNFMKGKISSSEVVDHISKAVSVGLPGMIKKGVKAAALALCPAAGVAASVVVDNVVSAVSHKAAALVAKGIQAAKPVIAAVAETAREAFNTVKEGARTVFNFLKGIFA